MITWISVDSGLEWEYPRGTGIRRAFYKRFRHGHATDIRLGGYEKWGSYYIIGLIRETTQTHKWKIATSTLLDLYHD